MKARGPRSTYAASVSTEWKAAKVDASRPRLPAQCSIITHNKQMRLLQGH